MVKKSEQQTQSLNVSSGKSNVHTLSRFESRDWMLHLGVDVQDADLGRLHHLVDGVDLGAVQVAVVLAVLQEAAALDVALHLAAAHKGVHLAVPLVHLGLPRGDCAEGLESEQCFSTAGVSGHKQVLSAEK